MCVVKGFKTFISAVFVCALLPFAPAAEAQSAATGLSAFGIQSNNFQGIVCKRFLRVVNHSPTPAIAILYKTFGVNNKCLRQFWTISKRRNRPHLTEIHFSNEVGRRNRVHDIHDFKSFVGTEKYNKLLEEMSPELEKQIRERAREIVALIEPYKDSGTFILSTGLEDHYTLLAWQNVYRILSEEWPYEIARSTLPRYMFFQKDYMPSEIYIEYHGYRSKFSHPQRCIANGDGQDVDFLEGTGVEFLHAKPASMAAVKGWLARAEEKNCITFLWTGKWQGIHNGGKLTDPLKRVFRFDASDMKPIKKLLSNSAAEKERRHSVTPVG